VVLLQFHNLPNPIPPQQQMSSQISLPHLNSEYW
jgi:hypothetical protein